MNLFFNNLCHLHPSHILIYMSFLKLHISTHNTLISFHHPNLISFGSNRITNKDSLQRFSFPWFTYTNTTDPNFLMCPYPCILFSQTPYGVLKPMLDDGDLFTVYAEIAAAPAQNFSSSPDSHNRHLTFFMNVWFMRSATPFCCGV